MWVCLLFEGTNYFHFPVLVTNPLELYEYLLLWMFVGTIPTRGDKIFTYIYISISSLWCRGQARRWVLLHNSQCFQNSAESGKRNVLTLLGSLCLACNMRDTAWSCFIYFYMHNKEKHGYFEITDRHFYLYVGIIEIIKLY